MMMHDKPMSNSGTLEVTYQAEKQVVIDLAIQHLEARLRDAFSQDTKVLFLVSGGSNVAALKAMDQKLLTSPNITVFPLDERYDAGEQNNSLIIQAEGIPIHPMVPQPDESVVAFGDRYNFFLDTWMKENQTGKIIAIIGIGPDGHTAGISPGNQVWFDQTFAETESNPWAVGYVGNLQPSERVTVTPKFLAEKIHEAVIIATGENKTAALHKVFGSSTTGETPARILNQTKGKMTLYTDVML